jgi:hypothetical protein
VLKHYRTKIDPGSTSFSMNVIAQSFRERGWQVFAVVSCILFGSIFILNVHPIGDGLWFWYAILLRNGQRLYADMHLPLQPLFVLLTAWTQELLGKGWLASKVLALAQVVAYCAGLFLISGYIAWKDWQKAIVITAVFAMTMGAFYFRFDDYHITGYCLEVFSIYLLLRLNKEQSSSRLFSTAGLLGAFAGLSISNRLNDGAALFMGSGLVLLFVARRNKIVSLGLFYIAALAAVLGVILFTGDSIHDWAVNSIFRAAAIKGGTGHVLYTPFSLLFSIANELPRNRRQLCALLAMALLAVLGSSMSRIGRERGWIKWSARGALCVGLILPNFRQVQRFAHIPGLQEFSADIGVLACVLFGALALVRMVLALFSSKIKDWNPLELLLVIPFLQLWAGAMTSGRTILEAYPAIAMLLLLLPLFLPVPRHATWQRGAYVTLSIFIAISFLLYKTVHPYEWHHFKDKPFFVDREWYRHPVYGLMYIERDQSEFVDSICAAMKSEGPANELLSVTNPYANYFCDVVPWHGYVQTWYDTTSPQTIQKLIDELQGAPPKWIVYQRSLDTMRAHEKVFTSGQRLPHRALDWLVMDRIIEGKWVVVQREVFQEADWILIRTHS